MASFYLDEDIPPGVGAMLAQNGHDVVRAAEAGNRSLPDPEHLLAAAESRRILVTFNRRDFRELHRY